MRRAADQGTGLGKERGRLRIRAATLG